MNACHAHLLRLLLTVLIPSGTCPALALELDPAVIGNAAAQAFHRQWGG